jgi:hypothetical protein
MLGGAAHRFRVDQFDEPMLQKNAAVVADVADVLVQVEGDLDRGGDPFREDRQCLDPRLVAQGTQ